MKDAASALDRVDRRILALLQGDGRMSNLALDQAVHLSPTAVLERVRRLVREQFILGYEARLNPHKLGASLLVCIEVMLERSSADIFERFKEAARERPEILECYLIAGDFDYLLKTRVSDMDAYREFLHKVLLGLPGVRETRSYVVMEEVKSTQALQVE